MTDNKLFIVNSLTTYDDDKGNEVLDELHMTGAFSSLGRAQDAAAVWHKQAGRSAVLIWNERVIGNPAYGYEANMNDGLLYYISVVELNDAQDT